MATDHWRVKLDVPAATRYLHIVRLTAAGAATEAGLDAGEVEDIKIAVDELCSVAIAASTEDQVLSLQFIATDDGLQVEATIPTSDAMEVDEMGQAIISATVDAFTWTVGDPGGFHLAKSHRGR